MSVRHIPFLDSEKWYLIGVDHGKGEKMRPWRYRTISLHGPRSEASIHWCLFRYHFGVGFQFGRNGSESDVGLNVYFGPIGSVYLRLRAPWTAWARISKDRHPKDWYYVRHYGLRLFPYRNCYISGEWADRDGLWESGQPWWRSWAITKTMILGRTHHESITIDSGSTSITMPEGDYPAAWEEEETTSRYVRFPGTLLDRIRGPFRRQNVTVRVEGGIPSEGKGENSWDCGMDGTFAVGSASLSEAIEHYASSVLRDRKRNGGPHNLQRPTSVSELVRREEM